MADTAPAADTPTEAAHPLDRVRALIAEELGLGLDQVRGDHDLDTDLGCDELDLLSIWVEIERAFAITVPDHEAGACDTVAEIAALVAAKVAAP